MCVCVEERVWGAGGGGWRGGAHKGSSNKGSNAAEAASRPENQAHLFPGCQEHMI